MNMVTRTVNVFCYTITLAKKEDLSPKKFELKLYDRISEAGIRKIIKKDYPDYSLVKHEFVVEKFFYKLPLEDFIRHSKNYMESCGMGEDE